MRFPKNVINAFAVLGVVSFIVFACAAAEESMSEDDPVVVNDPNNDPNDDPNDDTNNELPIVTTGKYQMAITTNGGNNIDRTLIIMDTETGSAKHYTFRDLEGSTNWTLQAEIDLW